MRFTTLIIIIVVVVGGLWYANKAGYIEKLRKSADTFDAHLARGKGLYQVQKYEEAIEELDKAIKADPNHGLMPRALRAKGDCYKELRQPDKAIEVYEEIIRKYPDDKMRGDVEKAIEKVRALGYY